MRRNFTLVRLITVVFLLLIGISTLKAQYVINGNAANLGGGYYKLTDNAEV